MSNYPPDLQGYKPAKRFTLECPVCKEQWFCNFFQELGQLYPAVEEKAFCPWNCHDENGFLYVGKIVDENY